MLRRVGCFAGDWLIAAATLLLVSTEVGSVSKEYGSNSIQDTELQRKLFEGIKPDANPIVVYGEPPGSKIEFLRTGKSTCGKYLYAKVTVPPGSGPPPHVHHWTDEWFYVPTGGVVMFHGTREYPDLNGPPDKIGKDTVTLIPLEAGQAMYGPRNVIHGYTNATERTLDVRVIWSPDTPDVSILGYFLSIYTPVFKDQKLNARFNSVQPIKAVADAKKYGMNFSHDFWQYIEDVKYGDANHVPDVRLKELARLIKEGDEPCEQ